MNKYTYTAATFIFIIITCSCSSKEKINSGCSIQVSENVFSGKFDVNNITSIKIINCVTQQSAYPLPLWKPSNNSIEIHDPAFFNKFKKAIIAAGWKTKTPEIIHISGSVQIIVSFKKGPGAYLFCRSTGHSLGVTPMFEHDAYGNSNEPLFIIVNDAIAPRPISNQIKGELSK